MIEFINKIFGQKQRSMVDAPTRPVSHPAESSHPESNLPNIEPRQLIVACAQSVGRQRDHNEDAHFTLSTTLTSDQNSTLFGFFIVADGMGGHQHGEIASGIAVRSMANYIVRKVYTPLLSFKPTTPDESLLEIMQDGVQDAHRTILRQAPGSGTTMTALLILGDQLTLAHVGDTRAYMLGKNGIIESLTRDHSLVKRLVELGQITVDEAAIHPQRNVLYRALGQGEPFDPDITSIHAPEGGFILICSDGLWGVISETDIYNIVLNAQSPQQACQQLVDAANEAGGPDNITAILIRLPG